jgi:calcineurin-like phosphoesterase family protein
MMRERGLALILLLLAGCAHVPPPTFEFGVMGDAPYNAGEVPRVDALIDDMNRERLAFVAHVGDIGGNACDDATLEARKRQFARLAHPFILIPGDNEWTDCDRPAERLRAWRRYFCEAPIAVEHQEGEYCEHMRWAMGGFLFVTLNVPGHDNNIRHRDEYTHRMRAVLGWLDDSALLAQKGRVALVVMMQADPFLTIPRDGFADLRERLARLGERMTGKVFLVHGDTHTYRDDEPIPGVRRIEVWGSPIVSWIRGEVDAGEVRFSLPRYR